MTTEGPETQDLDPGVAAGPHGIDKDRLLPNIDKRRRDRAKKLGRELDRNGWATFVSGQAHTILTGKAQARRNAEIMLVREISRWREEVEELPPGRMADFERIINHGLDNPAPVGGRRTKG